MESKRRRWKISISRYSFSLSSSLFSKPYLANFIFCHAPLDINFIQKDQQTGSHEPLDKSVISKLWIKEVERCIPLPKVTLPVPPRNHRLEADLSHPQPKSTYLSFRNNSSSMFEAFSGLPRPLILWVDSLESSGCLLHIFNRYLHQISNAIKKRARERK